MTQPLFLSAKAKLQRADQHIADLQQRFNAFTITNPYGIAVGVNPETNKIALRLNFKQPVPDALALVIGDAVHNLRSALDHMTWELIGIDGGTQDRWLNLPTGDNRVNFESRTKGIKTPSKHLIDILLGLEVFQGGMGDALYALHLLDNSDKHTVLTPIVRAGTVSHFRLYNAQGLLNATYTDYAFVGGSGQYADIVQSAPGGHVELDNDAKVTPQIFFGNVEPVQGEAIFPTLARLREVTTKAIEFVEHATLDGVQKGLIGQKSASAGGGGATH